MPGNIRAGREFYRSVIDVATEEACPAFAGIPGFHPHQIQAAYLKRGRPYGDAVWMCVHCRMPWAELDEQANHDLRRPRR